jgi:hypothetical protein
MTRLLARRMFAVALAALLTGIVSAQQPEGKALTNSDIVDMVKAGLPESTIVAAMRAQPTNFDVTPQALIALNTAGIKPRIMDAMIAATQSQNAAKSRASSSSRNTATVPASPNMPSAALIQGDSKQAIPLERTKMTQTTAKAKSLGALAGDRALDSAMRAGISSGIAATGGGVVGSTAGGVANGVVGGLFSSSNKSKDVTYVWAVQGATSQTTLMSEMPVFEVSLGKAAGLNGDEYSPTIVKLTPTQNNWRLVGATEGKDTSSSRSALDWPIYSSFIEDRVPVQVRKVEAGQWQVSPAASLPPGDYAVVLRPNSKDKKFSGSDVARNQGDGLLFNSLWSFTIR